jgi:hypothetical protein
LQWINVVSMTLLLPGSTMESPNTNSAGARVWFADDGEASMQHDRRTSSATAIIRRSALRDALPLATIVGSDPDNINPVPRG